MFEESYVCFEINNPFLHDSLWGENFFNPTTKKWAKSKDADNKRSFNMYVLDPLYKVGF